MSKDDCDILVNLMILGDFGVGKTSLMQRFVDGNFPIINGNKEVTTIDYDFKVKKLVLEEQRIRLHMWDTAGQERFHALGAKFYRAANGILLVYDMTNEQSFTNVRKWIHCVHKFCESDDVPMVLLGNKCDLETEREVAMDQAQKFAKKHKMDIFETSAKEGVNINRSLLNVVNTIITEGPRIKYSKRGSGLDMNPDGMCSSCCSA